MILIKTPRLQLRKLAPRDAPFILKLVNEPAFIKNIGDKGIRNLGDARRFIREGAWTRQEKPGYGQFVIELCADGRPIGICGLLYRSELNLTDIGFALLREFRGQGFAYEAASAVIQYGHSQLAVPIICGLTSEENTPSIRLLEKLGLHFRKNVKTADDNQGTMIFSE